MPLKEQLKLAVDTMCAADDDDYKAMVRTLKMLYILPLKCVLEDYPELNPSLELDEERFQVFLQIVATRRDKARTTPEKAYRREYMREYMRRKRKAIARKSATKKVSSPQPR